MESRILRLRLRATMVRALTLEVNFVYGHGLVRLDTLLLPIGDGRRAVVVLPCRICLRFLEEILLRGAGCEIIFS